MLERKVCERCGANSDEHVMMEYEYKGDKKHICVRCLPALIHGKG
ncbi:hypothetical protein [Metallumcola ferriviriculae]